MTHPEAIAALIIADAAILTGKGRTLRGWCLSNLHSSLNRCERRGFAHGALIRDTMKTTVAGHGYSFPPVKRLTPALRVKIVDLVNASGLEVALVKADGAYRITFE